MTDLLENTVTVTGPKGDTFVFKIPSLHDEFRVAARVKNIRKQIDPEWDGVEQGLDWWTMVGMQAAATFETLLVKASVKWPYTAGKDGGPVVDSSQWPLEVAEQPREIYRGFQEQVATFRAGGATDDNTDGKEAVASKPAT